jgi:hypothetical protein
VRIFLSGNEEAARWYLPIAQAKVNEFVARTEKAGLSQNTYSFIFEESGARVSAQYAFGQVSMQIHAPFIPIPMVEEEAEEGEEVFEGPKTFYVNTTQGYFWVEVRYTDGVPSVVLTQFVAMTGDEFVYPGFALNAPGMIVGCFEDDPAGRYVLSQNGGVMTGKDEEKGIIRSTAIIDNFSRITVISNDENAGDFVIIKNSGGRVAEVRRVKVAYTDGAVAVERDYASIFMDLEGETNLYVSNLLSNPTWVHRKCSGSYFSPNKTIGYHVDIGADEDFLGNIQEVRGADLLDNTGGFEEPMFNHTTDLYRLAEILSFPVSVDGSSITLLLVSPTMGFEATAGQVARCWGGYGLTQSWAGCVDYQQDFDSWILSPRFVLCTADLSSGERFFADPSASGDTNVSIPVRSWDSEFGGSFVYDAEYSCDTKFYSAMEEQEAAGQCAWLEPCSYNCNIGMSDPSSTGDCAKGWTPYSYWEYFSRENLRNSKRAYFLFGENQPRPQEPVTMRGFYFLFDGLWHLDIGVYWTKSKIVGNLCGLCAIPQSSQVPGGNITFAVQNVDPEWVLQNGHEFVENLEIVTPLGYISWPMGGTVLGFVAKVPESFEPPHEPMLMLGGVEYQSENVDGVTIRCQRAFISDVCICEDNELTLDVGFEFDLNDSTTLPLVGGCAPFELTGNNATVNAMAYLVTRERDISLSTGDCDSSLVIKDACGAVISLNKSVDPVTGVVVGAGVMAQGDTEIFYHDLEAAEYTGNLVFISTVSGPSGNGALLQMPNGAIGGANYTVSFVGRCGSHASKTVMAGNPDCLYDFATPSEIQGQSYISRILCSDGWVYLLQNQWGLSFPSASECISQGTIRTVCEPGSPTIIRVYHNLPNSDCWRYRHDYSQQCKVY